MTLAFFGEAGEEFFDQESVVEDNVGEAGHLLIGEFLVGDAGDAHLIAISEHSAEFVACGLNAAGNDESGVTEIDDPDFAAIFDAPPVTQFGRQIGLTAVGHLGC
jgi:hypothetical protein